MLFSRKQFKRDSWERRPGCVLDYRNCLHECVCVCLLVSVRLCLVDQSATHVCVGWGVCVTTDTVCMSVCVSLFSPLSSFTSCIRLLCVCVCVCVCVCLS